MTTHQSPQFCANCFAGTLRGDVIPSGTVETIASLPTYVTQPEAGQTPIGVVVLISDAMGWELLNTRALADAYAKRIPAVVLVPEFMDGHAIPAEFLVIGEQMKTEKSAFQRLVVLRARWWLGMIRYYVPLVVALRPAVVLPRITAYIKAVRASPPAPFASETLKLGVAGFCWGGKYAVVLAHDRPEDRVPRGGGVAGEGQEEAREPRPLIDASFTGHPSLLSLPGDVEKVVVPLSVAGGTMDDMLPAAKLEDLKKVLEEKGGGVHETIVYEGAIHGFCVRGDPSDPSQAEMGLRAEEQAVSWFQKHLM